MKNKNIKKFFIIILLISVIYSFSTFSAIVYNDIKKTGPGSNISANIKDTDILKMENIYKETKLQYIKNIIQKEYTIKYDDINEKIKFAQIYIFLPEVTLETEEKSIVANYFLQTKAIDIIKEYAENYIIDFNQNRASMRCYKAIKQIEDLYIFSFMCNSIPMCDILIDFSINQCYSR